MARVYKERCLKEQRAEDTSSRVYVPSHASRGTIPIKINNSDLTQVSAFLQAGKEIMEGKESGPAESAAPAKSASKKVNYMYARSSQTYGALAPAQKDIQVFMGKYRKPKGSSAVTTYADNYHRMSGKSPYAR